MPNDGSASKKGDTSCADGRGTCRRRAQNAAKDPEVEVGRRRLEPVSGRSGQGKMHRVSLHIGRRLNGGQLRVGRKRVVGGG